MRQLYSRIDAHRVYVKKELGGFPYERFSKTLKNNFEEICDEVNNGTEAVALSLKSGRKVFIMPEKNYDNISHIVMVNTSENALK
mgnify:CR=1 FL=1